MKFITEEDLRYMYQREPFSQYHLENGARLTPGARQFLGDRRINMFEDGTLMSMGDSSNKQLEKVIEVSEDQQLLQEEKLLLSFLKIWEDLSPYNEEMADRILDLGERFSKRILEKVEDEKKTFGEDTYSIHWMYHQKKRSKVLLSLLELRNRAREYRNGLSKERDIEQTLRLMEQINLMVHEIVGENG